MTDLRGDSSGLGGDVTINAVRYPLVRDPKRGLAWWHEEDEPLEETLPKKVARAIWEKGFYAGAGEGTRLGEDTAGYAFTAGFDCTNFGQMRFAGRMLSLTPTLPMINAPTHFEEAAPTSTAVFATFTFTTGGTTTDTVTHTLSVAPKAVILWTAGKTATGTVSANHELSFGFSDGTRTRCVRWKSTDAAAAGQVQASYKTTTLALNNDSSLGTVGTIGATTFDVTWSTVAPATGTIIHGLAFGGEDIEAYVKEWQLGTSSADVSVTDIGFEPDFLLHLPTASTNGTTQSDTSFGLGCSDADGKSWTVAISAENAADPTNTWRRSTRTTSSLSGQTINSSVGGQVVAFSFRSMDTDGFTVAKGVSGTNYYVATLCLKGLRAKAFTFNKGTGAGPASQAITGIGFTPTAVMLASFQNVTSASAESHARLGIGAATSTSTENCAAISDTDNLATSSTDGLDEDTSSNRLFVKIDNDTQTKDAIASLTSFDSDGLTLSWDTNDAVATHINGIAFAALATGASKFVYCHNGSTSTKVAKSGTTLTQTEQKDWGGGAVAGFGTLFESAYYLPLGATVNAQKRTNTAPSTGTDTWASEGYVSLAFSTIQDGTTARIMRAQTNNVAMSADGDTYGSNFEQGDSSVSVAKAVDSGTSAYVAKLDGNVYQFDATGSTRKITNESPFSTDSDNGCGLFPIPGTDACIFTNQNGAWFFDGQTRPRRIGLDAILTNQPIDNITHEPVGVKHLETWMAGKWIYHLTQVTESSTTKTYIEVWEIQNFGSPPVLKCDTWNRLDGIARGLLVDSENVLWTTYQGAIVCFQLGPNGSPDPGRDAIGFGAASTTYWLYGPETDLGMPQTVKYLHSMEAEVENNGATTPVDFYYQVDGGTVTALATGLTTANGILRSFVGATPTDYGFRWRPVIRDVTTSGYDNTTTSPLVVRNLAMNFFVRPEKVDIIHFIVDCGEVLSTEVMDQDAKARRDTLKELARGRTPGPAAACVTPDGDTIYINVERVSDARMDPTEGGAMRWVVDCYATEWTIASQT